MQTSEFTSTRIALGSAQVHIHQINRHAKFAPPAGFCSGGCGWVTLTQNLTCPICRKPLSKTKKQPVITEAIRKFEQFITINNLTMNEELYRCELTIPMEWGGKQYQIPISLFREYTKLKDSPQPDPYRGFFQRLKPCP